MIKISFTPEEIDALHQQRIHHPHPRVRLKMEALYLKSQSFAHRDIARLCRISESTLRRYLQDYAKGSIDKLSEITFYRPRSELEQHREVIAAAFGKQPPATVAEAAARIKELTGLERKPTQVRTFIKSLGMKPLKVGTIPAKADVLEQESYKKKQLEPRIAQARAGERALYFVDAAHFVFGPFLGILWCFQRLFVKAPSGRQRLNVLAALDAISHELVTVSNLSYINAESVCELLRLLAARHVKTPITVVLDNARYQRCKLVQELAQSLGIELLFLPPYSPNLNLIERFWKFVKKHCLYSKYYPDSAAFQAAILSFIAEAPSKHNEELASLLTLKFQTFKDVSILTEAQPMTPSPPAQQSAEKALPMAA